MDIVTICHLSDIHFNMSNDNNIVIERVEKIGKAISSECFGIKNCIILVSGDIAQSGKYEEYEIAYEFFGKLESYLKKEEKNVYYEFIPGNHDCHIDHSDSIRRLIINNMVNTDVANIFSDQFASCLNVQSNYYSFTSKFSKDKFTNKLNMLKEIKIGNITLLINQINTAWMYDLGQKPNNIFIPESLTENFESTKYDIVISMFHHPYSWIHDKDRRQFMDKVELNSDIILTGHEHILESSAIEKVDSKNDYYSGGVLQNSKNKDESEFNIITVDLDKKEIIFNEYKWEVSKELYICKNRFGKDFNRNKSIEQKICRFNNKFYDWLNELDIPLYKANIENIKLEDIFVVEQQIKDSKTNRVATN